MKLGRLVRLAAAEAGDDLAVLDVIGGVAAFAEIALDMDVVEILGMADIMDRPILRRPEEGDAAKGRRLAEHGSGGMAAMLLGDPPMFDAGGIIAAG